MCLALLECVARDARKWEECVQKNLRFFNVLLPIGRKCVNAAR